MQLVPIMQGSLVGGSGGSTEAPSSGFTSMDVTDGSPIVDVLISPTFSSQELSILLDVGLLEFLLHSCAPVDPFWLHHMRPCLDGPLLLAHFCSTGSQRFRKCIAWQ